MRIMIDIVLKSMRFYRYKLEQDLDKKYLKKRIIMKKLTVLWKSSNVTDIERLIIPYILSAKIKGWWDDVEVIIWGDSQHALAHSKAYQDNVVTMLENGIHVFACKACADSLGVSDALSQLNIKVMYTGEMLSERLQDNDRKVLVL
jgi:hypothetical protein